MSEQEIMLLAGMVREISDTVWDIAMIRVYAMSVQYAIWSLIFFVSWIATSALSVRFAAEYKKNRGDSDVAAWVLGIAAFLSLIVFAGFLASSIARAVAPEWYALQQILLYLK